MASDRDLRTILARKVEALRTPIQLAASNGFAGLRAVSGLGATLRAAVDDVIVSSANARVEVAGLAEWRSRLDAWEQLDHAAQELEIARGMRLIARLPSKRAPTVAPPLPVVADPDPLAAAARTLPGIGPSFAERLAEHGLTTVEDLLWVLPRRYDDARSATTLAEACLVAEGERATFSAVVVTSRMVFVRGRRWAEVTVRESAGAPARAMIRWFNVYGGIDKRMPPGATVVLSGPIRRRAGRVELANPDIVTARDGEAAILVRYPDVAGIPGSRLRRACATACERVGPRVSDGVPEAVERASGLPALGDALARLHAPPPDIHPGELAALNAGTSVWQRRLAFGELFALGIVVAMRRRERRSDAAIPCPPAPELRTRLAAALPFAPTTAQRRVIDEVAADLAREVPMNRLLQGDVGSGKTAVAFAAALQVALAKRQTAVMAPTELLAEQHFSTIKRWANGRLRSELLTASTPKAARASLLALLAAGEIDVLIGTHALLSEGVGFAALGLVVIDEQHRFGVAQRARLRDKGDGQGAPHLLVMTATPIPRTLALTAYGDLDVSVLDELPPGRTPVTTKLITPRAAASGIAKAITARVTAGERAYVVCSKIAPSESDPASAPIESDPARDATTTADELARALPNFRVGLVHGRLDAATRDRVMRSFKDGELDILVATTVIEVGVDVPEATLIVIYDAERFGLAQLHQLRGRVGRGKAAASCVLVAAHQAGDSAAARLATLVETTDGFRIAEADLLLRGPGELLGPKQAGAPRLRFGDLTQHTELLLEARRHAERVLADDPQLVRPEHVALRHALSRRLAGEIFGGEAG